MRSSINPRSTFLPNVNSFAPLLPGLIVRYVLAFILVFTVFINLAFILESTRNSRSSNPQGDAGDEIAGDETADDDDEDDDDYSARLSSQRTVDLRVVSSKPKIEISVGGAVVVENTKNRGIHVAVLHQATGALMAHRFYDTYQAHEDEALILFLNMISPGRVLVFTILDEGL